MQWIFFFFLTNQKELRSFFSWPLSSLCFARKLCSASITNQFYLFIYLFLHLQMLQMLCQRNELTCDLHITVWKRYSSKNLICADHLNQGYRQMLCAKFLIIDPLKALLAHIRAFPFVSQNRSSLKLETSFLTRFWVTTGTTDSNYLWGKGWHTFFTCTVRVLWFLNDTKDHFFILLF